MTTENRTFIGETVAIVLDHHAHASSGAGPLVLTSEQFEKWCRP